MTQIININAGFLERITVSKIDAIPGSFHVKVETQYNDSRNPEAWRTVYQTTCGQWGLEALGLEVYEAATQTNLGVTYADQSVLRSPSVLRVGK